MICVMGGPVAGGLPMSDFWWGSAFLLGVPAVLLLLIPGPVLLPEHRTPGAPPPPARTWVGQLPRRARKYPDFFTSGREVDLPKLGPG